MVGELSEHTRTLAQCSIVTTTREPEETRSIAPPIPLTIFPCVTRWLAGCVMKPTHQMVTICSPLTNYCSTYTLPTTHRDDPVGEVAVVRHLHRTEEREVHLPCKVEHQRTCMGLPNPLYLLTMPALHTCY
mgnify:CR=1 FL=1